ncbi:ribonuclease P/MRP protein subunit POP8 [Penicillium digitatum]|uniref:Ribonucleases P/MRP subunit Pop8-like domain-containing protein n=3 Tax=Penicillium digitatum TaxID=36651 RepID=K9G770_PEND2|nr:hypothetical protein PDIP_50420 [Penicillium digitatum Pd1]EKV10683.1 hypothetical protein PDIG_55210 [Penicillium digitatum PHI26]EKV13093.1 hypothetical protein PDIP_50420 [Penicillium digitatum Pd1]KAG0155805.1 hypothetical protein PDIDSM_2978 [Penicillium digitatum]QQK43398.1 ribonuclease P/MRP protein subunit POP8 [Penicillium digitatum]
MTDDAHNDMEIDTEISLMENAKRKAPEPKPKTIHFTSRNPPWTYLKLKLVSQPGSTSQHLDAVSARTYLSSALSQFLGLTGAAIPIDILKIETGPPSTTKLDIVWIRVPREDASAVVSAVSSWIGSGNNSAGSGDVAWRVCAKGNFLGALVAGSGADLFVP